MSPKQLRLVAKRLPAFFAGMVILFWPVLVDASCCCKQDKSMQQHASATIPACSHCQTTNTNCATTADAPVSHCGGENDCESCLKCSGQYTLVASTSMQVDRSVLADWVLAQPSVELVESTFDLPKVAEAPPPRFLFAQQHCAQICCWLK
ncbi:hypothetical protein Pla22_08120 [Rubripirellula amarantea]|uniref:Uncharacterized protein n=1 Tax=Rubripirellula amarantea TaxID=2527999 RepID=A0A5C5WQL3_9BACT|nr:hypothetical protein Pla22_08120 [Rubripirellula amarantea]